MDFYKKDKGPSKVSGGDPSTGVAKQASDVGPLQAAPELAGLQNNSKNGTISKGANSSYSTSSGLINMLDVTQGAANTLQGAVKITNQLDDMKLTQMQKELAEAQAEESWSNPEDPNYIGEAAKYAKTKEIYGKYGDTFYTDRGRATYDGTVAQNNIAEADYNYMVSVPQLESKAAGMLAQGVPEHEVFAWKDEQLTQLKSKHAKDPARVAAIEQTQFADAAANAQAISTTVNNAYETYAATGAMDKLIRQLPVGIGQEEFQKAVLTDIAKTNPDSLGPAIMQSYDPNTGEFGGAYSGGLNARIKKDLGPKYTSFVNAQTKQADAQQNMLIQAAPTTTAMESVDYIGKNNLTATGRLDEGMGRTAALVGSRQTTVGNADRLAAVNGFYRGYAQQVMKTDPNLPMGDLEQIIRDSINGAGGEEALTLMGISEDNKPAVRRMLEAQALQDLKIAKDATVSAQTKVNEKSRGTALSLAGADTSKDLTRSAGESPWVQAVTKAGHKSTFPMTVVLTGDKAVDDAARVATHGTQVREGSTLLQTIGNIKGTSAKETQQKVEEFQLISTKVAQGKLGPEAIEAFLTEEMKDSGFSMSPGSSSVSRSISFDNQGDAATAVKANMAALLPLLTINTKGSPDPKDKDYNPQYGMYDPQSNPTAMTSIQTLLRDQMDGGMRDFDMAAGLSEGGKVAITDSLLQTKTLYGAQGTSAFINATLDAVFVDGDNGNPDSKVNKSSVRRTMMSILGGQEGPPSPEDMDTLFKLIEASKRGNWTAVSVLTDDDTGTSSIAATPDVRLAMDAATAYRAGGKVARHSEYGQGGFWANPGDTTLDFLGGMWESGYSNVNDQSLPGRSMTMSSLDQIQVFEAAKAAGILDASSVADGQATFTPEYAGKTPEEQAKAIANALTTAGLEQVVTKEDGVVTGVALAEIPTTYGLDKQGQMVPVSANGKDFSGGFNDFISKNASGPKDSGFFEGMWTKAFNPHFFAANKAEALSLSLKRHSDAAGIAPAELAKRKADPLWRESMASWAVPANAVLLGDGVDSKEDRMALGTKIDDTLTTFMDQGITMEGVDIMEVSNFRDAMLAGTLDGTSDIWKRAQEIARDASLDANNMPMFVINQAILATLMDDDSVHAINPMSMVPKAGVSEGTVGYRDMRYEIQNLETFKGRGHSGYVNIPLFAPTRTQNQLPMDTRTMIRTDTGELRQTARDHQANENKSLTDMGIDPAQAKSIRKQWEDQMKADKAKKAQGRAPSEQLPSADLSMGSKLPQDSEEELSMWTKLNGLANKIRQPYQDWRKDHPAEAGGKL